ncbi:MAG: hypothetical protein ACLRFI_01430 [Alphaproteobacteria bacterium]
MKKIAFLSLLVFVNPVNADVVDLDVALRDTYYACMGIENDLDDMKKLAGINTVVTGIGTVSGGTALAVGVVKQKYTLEKLRSIEDNMDFEIASFDKIDISNKTVNGFKPDLKSQTKKLGNWRTGLLAVSTASNIAGVVIASKNKNNTNLKLKIDNCLNKIDGLKQSISMARFNGVDVDEAVQIYNACSQYQYVDVDLIKNRAKGAEISSVVGGVTGTAGTVASVVANNETDAKKEHNLDVISNVLAGGTTVATGVAVVFNAKQISEIKKIVSVANKCESLLK